MRQLADHGYLVRGMTRDPDRARAEDTTLRAEWVRGDLRDAGQVLEAMRGVQHVLITSGSRNWFGIGDNTGREVDVAGMRHVLAAARAVRFTGRIGYVSTLLVTRRWLHPAGVLLNLLRGGVLRDKWEAEELLRRSQLDYGILRPGALHDEQGGISALRLEQGDRILGSVSRQDVARVLVAWLERPWATRISFDVIAGRGVPPETGEAWDALFGGLVRDGATSG